jgi:hypothetical protein
LSPQLYCSRQSFIKDVMFSSPQLYFARKILSCSQNDGSESATLLFMNTGSNVLQKLGRIEEAQQAYERGNQLEKF